MNLDFIARPLGAFLYFIYNSLSFLDAPNHQGVGFAYGLSIILFTLVIKMVLLPLTLKQLKSTSKMQKIQPQIKELQTRHKNDKEKLNTEMMKVYKENNVNPAGGCLPLLIQMPIIFALYWVIVQPLKLMLGKTQEQIANLVKIANDMIAANNYAVPQFKANSFGVEINVLNFFNDHADKFVSSVNLKLSELINMNFLGLHLGVVPTFDTAKLFGAQSYIYLPLLLLPILGVITTFISAKLSIQKPLDPKGKKDASSSMQNTMLYIGPIMTLIFSFQLPAGVVLYWTVGYAFQIFQQMYVNKTIYQRSED